MYIAHHQSPLGLVEIRIQGADMETSPTIGLTHLTILDDTPTLTPSISSKDEQISALIEQTRCELDEYFAGKRHEFTLPLTPQGTAFEQRVWSALQTIPFGTTRSYSQQTELLGDMKAIRAVAAANGRNPLWLVVPCHRVIGKNGDLTGYAGGLWRKEWLLRHEGALPQARLF